MPKVQKREKTSGKSKGKEGKERAAGSYDRVGDVSGSLTIGGAEKKWASDPTFTYCPLFHKAAPLDQLEEWLDEHEPKQKKAALRGSFNPENIKNDKVRAAYERDVENAEEDRKLANKEKNKRLRFNLNVVIGIERAYREQKKNQKDDIGPRGTGKRQTNLKDKVKALKGEGKVLDVTFMDKKGNKAKKVVWSAKSIRRRLSSDKTDRFYYVVYSPHNEHASEGVRNFLLKYGNFDESRINDVVDAIEEGSKVNFNKGRSPTRASPYLTPKPGKKTSAKKTSAKKTSGKNKHNDDSDDEDAVEDEDIFGNMSEGDSEEDDE